MRALVRRLSMHAVTQHAHHQEYENMLFSLDINQVGAHQAGALQM